MNRTALLIALVAWMMTTPSSAEDHFSAVKPPPTRLVSLPSTWEESVTPLTFDLEPITPPTFSPANCDGIFDQYLLESQVSAAKRPTVVDRGTLWQRIKSDHSKYYDVQSFKLLAGGFLIGAAVANTQLDQQLQDHFQGSVRNATSDDWFEGLHGSKELGNGRYTLPIYATAWAAGAYFDETPVLVTTGRWGERSLRSFLVGAPPLILAQRLTGGSRPGEKDRDSRWLPFQDNNGVSGHAFMSSLPFINAAKMTDRRWLKATFYAGSLLGPLSRVNDDDHYPSQVALGWWMAYVAATAIDRAETASGKLQFYPYMPVASATPAATVPVQTTAVRTVVFNDKDGSDDLEVGALDDFDELDANVDASDDPESLRDVLKLNEAATGTQAEPILLDSPVVDFGTSQVTMGPKKRRTRPCGSEQRKHRKTPRKNEERPAWKPCRPFVHFRVGNDLVVPRSCGGRICTDDCNVISAVRNPC